MLLGAATRIEGAVGVAGEDTAVEAKELAGKTCEIRAVAIFIAVSHTITTQTAVGRVIGAVAVAGERSTIERGAVHGVARLAGMQLPVAHLARFNHTVSTYIWNETTVIVAARY